jgi:hypothetical protein
MVRRLLALTVVLSAIALFSLPLGATTTGTGTTIASGTATTAGGGVPTTGAVGSSTTAAGGTDTTGAGGTGTTGAGGTGTTGAGGTATTIANGTSGEETATTASMESGTTAVTEATEGEGTTEDTEPETTLQPAVTVDTTPVAEVNPDWTYRFFIPTLLVLAALVVIVTVIQYFTRVVRNRYRIVR